MLNLKLDRYHFVCLFVFVYCYHGNVTMVIVSMAMFSMISAETPCCLCTSISNKAFIISIKGLHFVTEIDCKNSFDFW